MANLKGQKVLFSIFNEEQQLFRTQEILISRKSEDIGYSVYNKLGDHISFSINVFVTGTDSRFVVENNEAFGLSFVLYRLDIF